MTQAIKNQLSKQAGSNDFFTKSAVCLQNTFLPITSKPLNIEKIFFTRNVHHPKPVIWYVYIFSICQLFVYFFAPEAPNGHHKDFLDLVFCPFMNFKPLKTAFSDKIFKKISLETIFRSPRLFWYLAQNVNKQLYLWN